MSEVASFHFNLEASVGVDAGGIATQIPVSLVGDFQAPDRARLKLNVSLLFFTLETETVIIGDTVYSTDPVTGEWQIESGLAIGLPSPTDFAGGPAPALDDAVLVGLEFLDGTQVYHLRGMIPGEILGAPDSNSQADYWIGVENYLILKLVGEGEVSVEDLADELGGVSVSGPATIALTVVFSNYGAPVLIEAPEITSEAQPSGGPSQRVPDQGTAHIRPGEPHAPYNSVPATSGPHQSIRGVAPAPWGVHDEVLADEVLVHNLEHGGIGVHYDCPEGCAELVDLLTAIVDGSVSQGAKLIMSPYPGMDTTIALTAWNFIDKFEGFDVARIVAFIQAHLNSPNSPEPRAP